MKNLLMLAVAVVAPAFLVSPVSLAAAETKALNDAALRDAEIIGIVQAVNQAEIDSGNLASDASSNSDVKVFAQRLAKEHYKAYVAFKELETRQNIILQNSSLSDRVKADEEKHLETLDRQQGILFDLDYASHEVEFHQKMLDLWDEKLIPAASNEELKRLLTDMRSSIADHLEDARKLKSSLGRKK
jgi:putative membrane protein